MIALEDLSWTMRLAPNRHVYTVNPGDVHVCIQSMQIRALRLYHALQFDGVIRGSNSRVVIVGAGASGLTFADAARRDGVHVTVVEAQAESMASLKTAHHRFISPQAFRWPCGRTPGENQHASLSWESGFAPSIREQILSSTRDVTVRHNFKVSRVVPTRGNRSLLVQSDTPSDGVLIADVVILALGFGQETQIPGHASPSYWDTASAFIPGDEAKVAVIGSGDGAIAEAVRLAMRTQSSETDRESTTCAYKALMETLLKYVDVLSKTKTLANFLNDSRETFSADEVNGPRESRNLAVYHETTNALAADAWTEFTSLLQTKEDCVQIQPTANQITMFSTHRIAARTASTINMTMLAMLYAATTGSTVAHVPKRVDAIVRVSDPNATQDTKLAVHSEGKTSSGQFDHVITRVGIDVSERIRDAYNLIARPYPVKQSPVDTNPTERLLLLARMDRYPLMDVHAAPSANDLPLGELLGPEFLGHHRMSSMPGGLDQWYSSQPLTLADLLDVMTWIGGDPTPNEVSTMRNTILRRQRSPSLTRCITSITPSDAKLIVKSINERLAALTAKKPPVKVSVLQECQFEAIARLEATRNWGGMRDVNSTFGGSRTRNRVPPTTEELQRVYALQPIPLHGVLRTIIERRNGRFLAAGRSMFDRMRGSPSAVQMSNDEFLSDTGLRLVATRPADPSSST